MNIKLLFVFVNVAYAASVLAQEAPIETAAESPTPDLALQMDEVIQTEVGLPIATPVDSEDLTLVQVDNTLATAEKPLEPVKIQPTLS